MAALFCLVAAVTINAASRTAGLPSVLSVLLVGVALAVAAGASKRRFGQMFTLGMLFFSLAAVHCIVGRLTAEPSTDRIWMDTTQQSVFFDASFFIIAIGLCAAALGYDIGSGPRVRRFAGYLSNLQVDERRLLVLARWAVCIGALIMFAMYAKLGFLPFAGGVWDLGKYRYLTVDITPDFVRDEWIITRADDILTYTLPLIVSAAIWKKSTFDRVLMLVGGLALIMPMRRANVFCVALVVMLMSGTELRLKLKKLIWVTAVSLVLYTATQLVFLNIFESSTDLHSVVSATSTGLPEVRDFGWILWLLNGHRYYGVTLIQPFVPLPSFVSDWKQRNTMGVITTGLIGMGREHREAGGLRVTFAGEGYMNFGLPGAFLVSLLLGAGVAAVEEALNRSSRITSIAGMYLASTGFVWVCFWTYLGGTQAFGTIKFGAMLLIALVYLARQKSTRSSEAVAVAT